MSSMRSPFWPDPAFWAGRRVLLTGHSGFKGSWLTLWLSMMGAEVGGFALAPDTVPNLFEALRLPDLCEHKEGDIRDHAAVAHAVAAFAPEVVIHMAAQPLVRRSYHQPLETMSTNVQGTANVLDACRTVTSVRAIVAVTTDKCYLNREWDYSYRETDPLGGDDPYSASKACAEIITSAWRASFFSGKPGTRSDVLLASARAGNVFGGGDWSEDRLLPDCVRAFTAGASVSLRNPGAVRPWQFVLEPLLGYLLLARALLEGRDAFAQSWNFGPSDGQLLTVGELAGQFAESWGDGARVEHRPETDAPHEAKLLLLDSGLATRQLRWTPQLEMPAALAMTARWYQTAALGRDLRRLSEEQINAFLSASDL